MSATGENIEGGAPAPEAEAVTDEVTEHEDAQPEWTIGLRGDLAIGIGTMIGAGMFVFPGLAAEQPGPAAALSFVLGGAIAMLVALPTSELATATPRSGGDFFISRSLGTGFGAAVGLGLWLGLVFASRSTSSVWATTSSTFVFGTPAEQVADRFLGPVPVGQREKPALESTPDEG